jgi:hypothetical protein
LRDHQRFTAETAEIKQKSYTAETAEDAEKDKGRERVRFKLFSTFSVPLWFVPVFVFPSAVSAVSAVKN